MSNLDYNWLMARLRECGVDLKCELCGQEGDGVWTILGEEAEQLIIRPTTYTIAGVHHGELSDVYGLACTNCGNLRLHALFPLLGGGDTDGRERAV